MSVWTDVLGVIHFPTRTIIRNKIVKRFEAIKETAPTGSEGGLTFSLVLGEYYGTMTVSGSLRDYDRPTEILNWWKSLHTDWGIRGSVIAVQSTKMSFPLVMLMDDSEDAPFDFDDDAPKCNFKLKEFY